MKHQNTEQIRGETFVTRKITRAPARIALGLQDMLYLGNLNGITTYIRDFVKMAFAEIGVELKFNGKKENEEGKVTKSTILNLVKKLLK